MFCKAHFLKHILAFSLGATVLLAPCIELHAATNDDDNANRSFLFFGKKKNKKKAAEADTTAKKSEYEELTSADSNVISEGLFKVIRNKKGDYYFEIPRELIGRDMLIINKFVRVPSELNDAGVNRGINYANQMIKFDLSDDLKKVIVRQSRPLPDVPTQDAIARSVRDNYISPVIYSFKAESYNPDSTTVVIKANDMFNGQHTAFNNVFSDINIGTPVNADLSHIKSVKAFDTNIYAVSELSTKVTEPGGTAYITVEVGSTLLLLPEKPMTRRYVSPRIGYFTVTALRYSDSQQRVKGGNYITRWRLEPRDEDRAAYLAGKIVDPKTPITFYIDNSTPRQWRKYIKQGIEEWNSAFEMAGFSNAIRAIQIEDNDSVDMDDVSYSTLTYAASAKSNAMGPSITDPRSGEILEADIMWWHNVLDILHDWLVIQTGAVNPDARSLELPEHLVGDAMRFVACHEVGHSLGLRHNMIASSAIPTDSLRSRQFTDSIKGTASSIMDYARFNYVAQPGDDVQYLTPHIGPYDRLAIEYGYRWFDKNTPDDENDILQELLDNHDGPLFRYSEAQDSREAIDPRALSEDLGDDPVKSAKYGIANLKRIVPRIIDWTDSGKRGQDYDEASRIYYSAIGQWQRYVYHVLANIGGIYVDNTTMGDGRHTYAFVPAKRQREALQFIIDEALTQPSWLFDADLSNYTFLVQNTPIGRMENSPNYILKNAQSYILWDLLSDNRIIRMYENEAMNPTSAFKGSEMMDMLHHAIFKKTIAGATPDVRERSVQKNFVDALIIAASETQGVKEGTKRSLEDEAGPFLLDDPDFIANHSLVCSHCHADDSHNAVGERTAGRRILNFYGSQGNRVSDAISLKRGELMRIRDLLINRRSSASRDARYHYDDLVMRINTALGIAQLKQ